MMASWTKEGTLQIIEPYRVYERLWNMETKDYANKIKREKECDELPSFV